MICQRFSSPAGCYSIGYDGARHLDCTASSQASPGARVVDLRRHHASSCLMREFVYGKPRNTHTTHSAFRRQRPSSISHTSNRVGQSLLREGVRCMQAAGARIFYFVRFIQFFWSLVALVILHYVHARPSACVRMQLISSLTNHSMYEQ